MTDSCHEREVLVTLVDARSVPVRARCGCGSRWVRPDDDWRFADTFPVWARTHAPPGTGPGPEPVDYLEVVDTADLADLLDRDQ